MVNNDFKKIIGISISVILITFFLPSFRTTKYEMNVDNEVIKFNAKNYTKFNEFITNKTDAYMIIETMLNRQLQWTIASLTILLLFTQMIFIETCLLKNRIIFYSSIQALLNGGFIFFAKLALNTYPIIAYVEYHLAFPRFIGFFDNFIMRDVSEMAMCDYNVRLLLFFISVVWQLIWVIKIEQLTASFFTQTS